VQSFSLGLNICCTPNTPVENRPYFSPLYRLACVAVCFGVPIAASQQGANSGKNLRDCEYDGGARAKCRNAGSIHKMPCSRSIPDELTRHMISPPGELNLL